MGSNLSGGSPRILFPVTVSGDRHDQGRAFDPVDQGFQKDRVGDDVFPVGERELSGQKEGLSNRPSSRSSRKSSASPAVNFFMPKSSSYVELNITR